MENDVLLPQAASNDEISHASITSGVPEPDHKGSTVKDLVIKDQDIKDLSAAGPDRTSVFTSLVREDGDIAGLVAYSIYKQNKLDWLQAFELAKSRLPTDAELASYIIGESTPRRLATYRHLAETTLAGTGPETAGLSSSRKSYSRERTNAARHEPASTSMLALYGIIAVLALIVLWFATHYVLAGR